MPEMSVDISIVIVTWNSSGHLPACLNSLLSQTIRGFEVILVDNGSTDNSLDNVIVENFDFPIIKKQLTENLGFAAANNIGARLASGKWLALLNADAFPEPDWLENLVKVAGENPEYTFFSSRQIQASNPELLDGVGDAYHISGLAWRQFYSQSAKEFGLKKVEVFSACAAAGLYLRNAFLAIGGFDEDYFSYFEDVDLGFRLRLIGGRCLYVPQAIVYHVGSASFGKVSDFVIYHGHRNLEWTYFKNMPYPLLWLYLPLHILMDIYFIFSFTFKGKRKAIVKAKWDALRGMPSILSKRQVVQKMRTVTVAEIKRIMTIGILTPYWISRRRRS